MKPSAPRYQRPRQLTRATLALLSTIMIVSPAMASIDLTAGDVLTSHTAVTGGTLLVWHAATMAGAGIGSNDPFLELTTSSAGTSQGYNTDGTVEFSSTKPGAEALPLSAVPQVVIGGVTYLEFALGLNATGSDPLHSLDELQIFQSDSAVLDANVSGGYDAGAGSTTTPFGNGLADDTLSGIAPAFDWFGDDSNSSALLQDDVAGQSNFDYLFYVPLTAIDMNKAYIYLYAEMGYSNVVNDGEDRWLVDRDSPPYCADIEGFNCQQVPEPSTSLLLLLGLTGLLLARRK
jgi:hypothetical protein